MDKIYTGFESLDKQLKINKGDLVVIGGRPAIGKTCLMCSMIEKAIERQKILFFSMELNKHVSVERMKNRLKDNENFKLVREVVDTDDIILTVAEMKLYNGVDIVFIDNFTELNVYLEISSKSLIIKLKELARRLNVAVIVTEVFVRNDSAFYSIYDIRHKEFMKYADKIVTLYRLDLDYSEEDLELNAIEDKTVALCIDKGYGGYGYGQANLKFDLNTFDFTEIPKTP